MNQDRNPANERSRIYKTLAKGVEHFSIVTGDVKRIIPTEMTRPATESELRETLKLRGKTPHEIDSLVANAEWA